MVRVGRRRLGVKAPEEAPPPDHRNVMGVAGIRSSVTSRLCCASRINPRSGTKMASILKDLWNRLAGAGSAGEREEPAAEAVEYKGFRIRPAPYSAKGGFQTAGVIEKDFESGMKEHRFVRAETHPSKDDAATFALTK